MDLKRYSILFVLFSLATISFGLETDDPDTFHYKNHPCKRSCKEGEEPKLCRYIFVVERYTTMSKACYDCPNNVTDCFRPHCIVADGVAKMVYSVNRQVPGPSIEVCENDMIEVEVRNKMLSETTTLHWHGFKQFQTGYMDGVPYVSQCPILPGQNFVYKFQATTTGTFFYHGHIGNQKGDGLFGAMIVHRITELDAIKELNIHGEHTVVTYDWSHRSAEENVMMDTQRGVPIKIDTVLINGLGRVKLPTSEGNRTEYTPTAEFTVTKGKNYRFRVIGAASEDCPLSMTIDDHEMKVISLDSNDIKPVIVDALTIWPGERIDFVLTANQKPGNYWIRFTGNIDCRAKGHQLAVLRYNSVALSRPKRSDDPKLIETAHTPRELNPYMAGTEVASANNVIICNLKSLEPNDKSLMQKVPDHKIYLSFDFYTPDHHGYHRKNLYGFHQGEFKIFKIFDLQIRKKRSVLVTKGRSHTPQFDRISMEMPRVPLMSQWKLVDESSFCNSSHPPHNLDCEKEYCQCTHVIQLRLNSVVELVMVDEGGRFEVNHPMHLHGHFFRVIASENLNGTVSIDRVKKLDEDGKIKRTFDSAPLKDTMKTPGGGYTIIRFHANNPGYWLFHCHVEPHVVQGMVLIFKVGEHEDFPAVPKDFPKCGN